MACSGCAKRREAAIAARKNREEDNLMGGYKYLNDRQIKARLEAYKRKYCKECELRFECDYENYLKCKKRIKNK
jgi:hypothetical protein